MSRVEIKIGVKTALQRQILLSFSHPSDVTGNFVKEPEKIGEIPVNKRDTSQPDKHDFVVQGLSTLC